MRSRLRRRSTTVVGGRPLPLAPSALFAFSSSSCSALREMAYLGGDNGRNTPVAGGGPRGPGADQFMQSPEGRNAHSAMRRTANLLPSSYSNCAERAVPEALRCVCVHHGDVVRVGA